jgi:hypothetical protein
MSVIKTTSVARLILVNAFLILGLPVAVTGQQAEQATQFTGSYGELKPSQARLIDDWIKRYGLVTGKTLDPETSFDALNLSTKTTFQAVTHALLTSELTDEQGNSLGTALDLIDHVDTVHGQLEGVGGDHQFRMYCRLKPGSRDILERSQQFKRGADNTVYHKAYPLNYRQQGGVPSIQISMALDETMVDIDVDYRSSKFPAAIINGHLTSSNSDVRAGNNFDRHTNRWAGLQNWWANWFSLPFVKLEEVEDQDRGRIIPAAPPKGRGKVQDAAYDFLNSWLVEGQPEVAMSYVSSRTFECERTDPDEPLDVGMAPFQMLAGMRRVNEQLGKPEKLEDVLTGIRVARPELKVIQQPHHAAFVLYDVAESKALEFDCANRGKPATEVPKGSKTRFGKYFATGLHINAPGNRGGTLALLWEKEGKNWKIVSYKAEPDANENDAPDLRAPIEVGAVVRVTGDPKQLAAGKDFLKAWYLDRDYDRALAFMADECFECVNLFLRDGEGPYPTLKEQKAAVRLGLSRTAAAFGEFKRLSDIMKGIDPVNPEVRIVTQPDEAEYTVLSIPDYLGASYGCGYRAKGGEILPRPDNPSYGNYFVQAYRSRTFDGEPVVLFLLWTQRSGEWKIVAFQLVQS